ncbi:acetylxylan esterase [Mangrovibacterium diazotrophicum]|uniref:Cephalosporin-C deacetylase-like acetyl esterase n=1 Tax=Mangrovibacterium diazotrophicum TaxID=1261403 RepID=A0A419W5B8_9BACT|nr:acetylxylan esterase [Mangrovibacterium diazotrophicum]RKD90644.1 cephalosporin-C deacetylase-like acetyl esterase [Mangrovibacterium diazotrophicum]
MTRLFLFTIVISTMLFSCKTNLVKVDEKVVSQPLPEQWMFNPGEGKDSLWASSEYNDLAWDTVSSFKQLKEQGKTTENSFGWYRQTVVLSDSLKNAFESAGALMLHLGRFGGSDEVYFNGQLIGKTSSFPPDYKGYHDEERNYFVDGRLVKKDGENLVAIKFNDGWGTGGFLGGMSQSLTSATIDEKLILDVEVQDSDWVFLGDEPMSILVNLKNHNQSDVQGMLYVAITTDTYEPVKTDSVAVDLEGQDSFSQEFSYPGAAPGFYRYQVFVKRNGKTGEAKKFNLGVEPEKIQSPIDAKEDLRSFWDDNLQELAKVAPKYKLTLQPEYSKLDYDIYWVEMYSLDNELIRGYYGKPKRDGKFPVIVEYMGYGSGPYPPTQTWDGFAYYVLSIRGQALNLPTNRFGTWVTYGLDSKENYYYRGAYMDVVRALDFVCSRPEIDASRIAVRGGSQGGALSIAAASLDKRVKVATPSIPFLSDFPDYFKIEPWPKSDFDTYMKEHPEASWEQVYDVLSYFDIKNLAQWITCPLYMGMGVQDNVCPPHTNFAAFNQVQSEKKWMACPDYGHAASQAYHEAATEFIKEKLQVK